MGQVKTFWVLPLLGLLTMVSLPQETYAQGQVDISQNFDSYTAGPPFVNHSTNDWVLSNGIIFDSLGGYSLPNACWFSNVADPSYRTPLLSNGIGTISFFHRNNQPSSLNEIYLETSPDLTNWTGIGIAGVTNNVGYMQYTNQVNSHTPVYLRWRKATAAPGGNLAGIDSISITLPPAYLHFTNEVALPSPVLSGGPLSLQLSIIPMAFASNISATAHYSIDGGAYAQIPLVTTGGFVYTTASNLPTISEPVHFEWYVSTTFDGPPTINPTNFPGPGIAAPIRYLVQPTPPSSVQGTVDVTGTFATNLLLVSDNQWRGVANISAPSVNPSFSFQAGTTNFGDTTPGSTILPVASSATQGQAAIDLTGTYTNHVSFQFNDLTLEYSAEQAAYLNLDEFGAATTNISTFTSADGWDITDGRTTDSGDPADTVREFYGRSLLLDSNGTASVTSAEVGEGLGSYSFWYRAESTNGSAPGSFIVQKSADGISNWIDINSASNIQHDIYVNFSGSLADRYSHYLRVVNDSTVSQLLLDELIVTEPSSSIEFSGYAYSPGSPTIFDSVTIQVDLTTYRLASNLTATLYYRFSTNGTFDTTLMTNSGTTYYGLIPPSQAGTMQYYVLAQYEGFGNAATPLPAAGAAGPNTYSISDAALDTEGFETWLSGPTYNGWSIFQGGSSYQPALAQTGDRIGILAPLTDSSITTPQLINGIGTISFGYRVINSTDPSQIGIDYSTDGTNWITQNTFEANNDTYLTHTEVINVYSPGWIRVRMLSPSAASAGLLLDDFSIYQPSAKVEFQIVQTHPGYPSIYSGTDVSCVITSLSADVPAINIDALLHYRLAGAAGFSGPIPFARAGNNEFATSIPIPQYGTYDRIEYYIEASFNGYYPLPVANQSPMFYPAGGSNSPAHYDVRPFNSVYDAVTVDDQTENQNLSLIGDNLWQQVLNVTSSTNPISLDLSAGSFYNGTNVASTPQTWGDLSQWKFDLPSQGLAVPGDTTVEAVADYTGQMVLRLNTLTGEYRLQRAHAQNFDDWLMSSFFFVFGATSGNSTNWFNSFDDISLSITNLSSAVTFDEGGWDNPHGYSNDYVAANWTVDFCKRVGITDYRQEMAPVINNGLIRPLQPALLSGVGRLQFDYRVVGDIVPVTVYKNRSWTNTDFKIETDSDDIGGDDLNGLDAWKSIYVRYSPSNHYQYRLSNVDETSVRITLLRTKDFVETELTSFVAAGQLFSIDADIPIQLIVTNMPTLNSTSVVLTAFYQNTPLGVFHDSIADAVTNPGSVACGIFELSGIFNDAVVKAGDGTQMMTDNMNNAHNTWTRGSGSPWSRRRPFPDNDYRLMAYSFYGTVPSMNVYVANQTNMGFTSALWDKIGTNTFTLSPTNIAYKTFSSNVHTVEVMHAIAEHKNGSTPIRIDNFSFTEWHAEDVVTNEWIIRGGLVVSNSASFATNYVELQTTKVWNRTNQYVRTERLSGIGAIGFRHRTIEGPGSFRVEWTTAGSSNNWQLVTEITDTTNVWQEFSWQLNQSGDSFVRILNTSVGDTAVCIDNFEVVEFEDPTDDAWVGHNLRISGNLTNLLFRGSGRSGYLNSDAFTDTSGGPYTTDSPYVRAPRMPRGVGNVGFWAALWDNTANPYGLAQVETSLDEITWNYAASFMITNTKWQYYSTDLFLPTTPYVRVINFTTAGVDRIAIDEFVALEPIGADLTITNVGTYPTVPLFNEDVYLEATLTRFVLDVTNIVLKAYWKSGVESWSQWPDQNEMDMNIVSSQTNTFPYAYTYRTTQAVPRKSVDTTIQYRFNATFDGTFSSFTSPKEKRTFENPAWYYPVNYNDTYGGGITTTPYYIVFSSKPRSIWINEVDYREGIEPDGQEYVEVVGAAGLDIANWKIEIVNVATTVLAGASYTITNMNLLPSDNNGHGFYVLGDDNVTNLYGGLNGTNFMAFTHAPSAGSFHFAVPGGVRLVRSMGAYEHLVCFGAASLSMTNLNPAYTYIGYDDFFGGTLHLTNSGSAYTNFQWVLAETGPHTPGSVNGGQTLIGTNPVYSAEPIVSILDYGFDTNNTFFIICTGTNDWYPSAWHSTNILSNWDEVEVPQTVYSNGMYTIWFPAITNSSELYYKVISTRQ